MKFHLAFYYWRQSDVRLCAVKDCLSHRWKLHVALGFAWVMHLLKPTASSNLLTIAEKCYCSFLKVYIKSTNTAQRNCSRVDVWWSVAIIHDDPLTLEKEQPHPAFSWLQYHNSPSLTFLSRLCIFIFYSLHHSVTFSFLLLCISLLCSFSLKWIISFLELLALSWQTPHRSEKRGTRKRKMSERENCVHVILVFSFWVDGNMFYVWIEMLLQCYWEILVKASGPWKKCHRWKYETGLFTQKNFDPRPPVESSKPIGHFPKTCLSSVYDIFSLALSLDLCQNCLGPCYQGWAWKGKPQ